MTMKRVLLPIAQQDEQRIEQLIETVLEVAVPSDATVVVAHAIPKEDEIVTSPLASIGSSFPQVLSKSEYDDLLTGDALEEDDIDEVVATNETVKSVTDRLTEAGVEYVVRGAIGEPGDALVALAGELDADRLVVGERRRTPTDKAIFGSVAQTLLLEVPCPVTFVRNE